jgi:hypothetical protein
MDGITTKARQSDVQKVQTVQVVQNDAGLFDGWND